MKETVVFTKQLVWERGRNLGVMKFDASIDSNSEIGSINQLEIKTAHYLPTSNPHSGEITMKRLCTDLRF